MVYDLRAAVRAADTAAVASLVDKIDVDSARQLGAMAPTLLALYTGDHTSPDVVRLAARTLHRHLALYDTSLTVNDLVAIFEPLLAGQPLPEWTNKPVLYSTLVGFLMPDGAAEEQLRSDLEPLWARAMEP